MIKGVIFDMDGVICHTNPYHSQAFKIFFEKRNMYPTEVEFGSHMYGKSNSYIFSHFFNRPVTGDELKAFEDEKESLFREIYTDKIIPIAGFMHFLESLTKSNLKLGVATSAPRANMDLILEGLRITHFFDSMLGSEDVTTHKPHPEVYQKSMKNLNLSPQDTYIFEDSYSGISAGLAAGCKVIGVLSSHTMEELPTCTTYINHYTEAILKEIF